MTPVYFNEIDPYAARWLRNLYPEAHVDGRSITDVQAGDLLGFTRVHFFGGIGGWEYALALAGWPEGRVVFTGSCPCQPFSTAGQRKGTQDERHLWPEFYRLIALCRPATVFGEQVASRLGRQWLAGVRTDLEALGYAVGAADLCAAGVGAPHIRQRLWWVAHAGGERVRGGRPGEAAGAAAGAEGDGQKRQRLRPDAGDDGHAGGVANAAGNGCREPEDATPKERPADQRSWLSGQLPNGPEGSGGNEPVGPQHAGAGMGSFWVEHPVSGRHDGRAPDPVRCPIGRTTPAGGGQGRGFWDAFDLIPCRDGKARRVEPGSFPLVDGLPFRLADGRTREGVSRKDILKGIGNAIVPAVAAVFIKAFMETTHDQP